MKNSRPKNIAASVRQRLLNISRESGDDTHLVWTRYATERLLYRLSVSAYSEEFVLKGAMLFVAWTGRVYRPTVDMDFLGYGEDSSQRFAEIFRSLSVMDVEPDGLKFDPTTVHAGPIREQQDYQGQRVTLTAFLEKGRIPIQVDIGFGDIITPAAVEVEYPTILKFPAPIIRTCPRETVVAEKLHAMVFLGIANSRMKDFFDMYVLAKDFDFDGGTLVHAIQATFQRRKTRIPVEVPLALTDEFAHHEDKLVQWSGFIRKGGLDEHRYSELPEILALLKVFLLPVMKAAGNNRDIPHQWPKGGPWR